MSAPEHEEDDWVRVDPLDDTPPLLDRVDTAADQRVAPWPAAEPGVGTADWEIPEERTHARNSRFAITLPTTDGIELIDLAPDTAAPDDEAAMVVARSTLVELGEEV